VDVARTSLTGATFIARPHRINRVETPAIVGTTVGAYTEVTDRGGMADPMK